MLAQADIKESFKTFLSAYPSSSRVWVYQSTRVMEDAEASRLEEEARQFATNWAAHGKALDATARVVFNRFLVLVVNDTVENPSGCSIDSSVHFVQEMERKFNTNFFDRLNLTLYYDGVFTVMSLSRLKASIADHSMPGDALLFDNSITTLGDLRKCWVVPVYDSWVVK
jgi:hypothetical protein